MSHPVNDSATMASVVSAIGTEDFESAALQFLHRDFGVEHYSVFRMKGSRPEFLGGASTKGPHAVRHFYGRHSVWQQSAADLTRAGRALPNPRGTTVLRSELRSLPDTGLKRALDHFRIVDRVMLCGRSGEDVYGISVLRSERVGRFEPSAFGGLSQSADILVAAFSKHTALSWDRPAPAEHFDSVEMIEENLKAAGWGMSERELQVSARLLFGISALGIAHDLGLREDTIATYRKRLYQRLQISSRYELLKKYLTLA